MYTARKYHTSTYLLQAPGSNVTAGKENEAPDNVLQVVLPLAV
jgi:hypothetical protein